MEKKLTLRNRIFVGTMLFGMFFGAGNLIFPVFMGQQAGRNVWPAIIGFLVTGIGLPLLGVAAIGISRSEGVFDLAKHVGKIYAYFFTILLYLIIGPFFALPRLATTSYQIGIAPFVGQHQQVLALAIFSVVFYVLAWWFCRKPSNIMVYVGKFLTPLFLLFLVIFILVALFRPMGGLNHGVQTAYKSVPFISGFTEGYNTMDALAALAFGITVVNVIRGLGVKDPKAIAKDTLSSGVLSIVLMGIIYTLMTIVGTMSLAKFPLAANGGVILAQTANYYFHSLGSILLAAIVILACLKTAIGLITSFGETFKELFPSWSYQVIIIVASLLPMIFANVGLTQIIAYSMPVLFFIYPLAMTLIIAGILAPLMHITNPWFYRLPVIFTIIPAILDGLQNAPKAIAQSGGVTRLLQIRDILPLATYGLSWVLPAVIAFIIGFIVSRNKKSAAV
ncbi:branched-chain amino acid transport protein [Agrilactobacillus composti DSM 18527 = JCM 14202]|uniref:Branched-chain amino acid transport system carrier protein n=1 Tax=Agrilactobacillus composti DSM 18527 = JCM 14202 TaxID=1423734 RepID=X0PWG1_9LACO|nr:branched-chain amino acid transport system II carrier protein [Agrilactobacillus composti]KRM32903.1 branched-chain amino acid transport protein [Agrilactobacillus composti DSM 18527 = JCM 14202]GAF41911.1 branched-chain amino acid transport system carrier protein [Agrilactobacillus composti DSM 18527 = JCM 14202]